MPIDLPTGTITFLFTDIEGSTQLWERHPESMQAALARHDELLRRAIESHNGRVVKTTGDGAYAAFSTASDALAAALAAQIELRTTSDELRVENIDQQPTQEAINMPDAERSSSFVTRHSSLVTIKSRMGIHTGEAELREGDYHGSTLNRAARLMSIGHGGQILLSRLAADLAVAHQTPDVVLRDLGEYRLRGLSRPERVYQAVAAGLPESFPPLNAARASTINLPQQPTEFIGRAQEVADIVAILGTPGTRLVTLVGPGGIGKTRLSIQAAATIARRDPERFADGVFFISLASLSSADSMAGAIAGALGFQFSQGERQPEEQLIDYLRGRKMLLILDNMEQLLDAGGADLPAGIAGAAGGVSILVTSRARLGIQGEHLFPVPGMRAPEVAAVRDWADPQAEIEPFSAMRLFLQRAQCIRPAFRLMPDNAGDVARICRRLEGMPLAIELAANWLELLSPAEIAAEIDRSLDLLATELRDVPQRQRSIRAIFDSTWQLSSEHEESLLPRLAVFRAPFSREAAEAVAGAGLRDLLALVNKSWLQRVKGVDGVSRFQMHELLRQFAEEKLVAGERAAVAERYARFYVALVAESKQRLLSAAQQEALSTLTVEFDHIRIAWDWLVARSEFETLADQMLRPLHRYGEMRGNVNVGGLFRRAIEACRHGGDCPQRVLAALLVAFADLQYVDAEVFGSMEEGRQVAAGLEEPECELGIWYVILLANPVHPDPDTARQLLALAETRDDDAGSEALRLAGVVLGVDATNQPAVEASVATLVRAGARFERRGDFWGFARVCQNLSRSQARLGRHADALATLDRAQAIYESLDDWRHVASLAFLRASLLLDTGRSVLAFDAYESAIAYSRERGDRFIETLLLGQYSMEVVRYGNIDFARQLRERSLAITRDLAFAFNEPWNLWELGEVYRVAGSPVEARRYYEEARAIFQSLGDPFGLAFHRRGLGDLALAAGDFSAAADHFAAAVDLLSELFSRPSAQVYMANGRARALIGLGRPDEALEQIKTALSTARRHVLTTFYPLLLATGVELALAAGRAHLAAMWCELLAIHPLTWNETRRHAATLAARARAAIGDEAAEAAVARGRSLDAKALIPGLADIAADEPDAWLDAAMRLIDQLEGQPSQDLIPL